VHSAVRNRLRLRPDATLDRRADGMFDLRLVGPARGSCAARLTPSAAPLARQLAAGSVCEAELLAAGGLQAAIAVDSLERGGWLERTVMDGSRPLATLQPRGRSDPAGEARLPRRDGRLSRFALLRIESGQVVVESPRAAARVMLHEPSLGTLVVQLGSGSEPAVSGLDRMAIDAVLELFARALLLNDREDSGEDDGRLGQWSLPDLMFHQRSRLGRHAEPVGATGRFRPPPALRPSDRRALRLPRPDLDRIERSDPPFQSVVERRRSLRDHDELAPITVAQLGELLYRSARNRSVEAIEGEDWVDRPYGSGGARHSLELYPLVVSCAGLARGLYRYEGTSHALEPIVGENLALQAIVNRARSQAVMSSEPQVVVLMTSRVGRVMSKYESFAYGLILKEVGVMMHQVQLVATAMGLASCPLGTGDSEDFARASGLDPYEEPSVGELILGTAARAEHET
jgi:oxazoline/thiazoline dehydrogenase